MTSQPRPVECRRFLEAVLGACESPSQHAAGCSACRALLERVGKLGSVLGTRPSVPSELHQPAFLEGVDELAIDFLEAGVGGSAVREAVRAAPPAAAGPVDFVVSSSLESILSTPVSAEPSPVHWKRMRAGLLAGVRSQPVALPRLRRLAMLGIAASVIAYVALGGDPVIPQPEIAFVDLEERPNVEFSIIRGGLLR